MARTAESTACLLAARAPYFHNGSARTLRDVVHFYENRFGLVLPPRKKRTSPRFLGALYNVMLARVGDGTEPGEKQQAFAALVLASSHASMPNKRIC